MNICCPVLAQKWKVIVYSSEFTEVLHEYIDLEYDKAKVLYDLALKNRKEPIMVLEPVTFSTQPQQS